MKRILTLTQNAVKRLRYLEREGDLLRIGTKKKGCSGLSYSLEIIKEKSKLDELIEQDGVKVVIEAKALFTLIGSEMDYQEDLLSSKFTFKNPNVTQMCGCGESFTTK